MFYVCEYALKLVFDFFWLFWDKVWLFWWKQVGNHVADH